MAQMLPGAGAAPAQLNAQDDDLVKKASMTIQAILASKESSQDVVQMAASGPEGAANVVLSALAMMEERQPIAPEDAPVVALTMLLTLIDFLVKIKKFEPSEDNMRAMLVAVMDTIARRYNASDADLAELDQLMPGISQAIMQKRGAGEQPPGEQPQQPQQPGMLQAQPQPR